MIRRRTFLVAPAVGGAGACGARWHGVYGLHAATGHPYSSRDISLRRTQRRIAGFQNASVVAGILRYRRLLPQRIEFPRGRRRRHALFRLRRPPEYVARGGRERARHRIELRCVRRHVIRGEYLRRRRPRVSFAIGRVRAHAAATAASRHSDHSTAIELETDRDRTGAGQRHAGHILSSELRRALRLPDPDRQPGVLPVRR